MENLTIESNSPTATRRLGQRLAQLLRPGDVLLLSGELGAGKTRLAQGIAQGLGVKEWVNSPSFVLLFEYDGRLHLYHADMYRLEGPSEVAELHLPEYTTPGVLLVEWPERAWEEMPSEHMLVRLEVTGPSSRRITLEAHGERYQEILESLRSRRKTKVKG